MSQEAKARQSDERVTERNGFVKRLIRCLRRFLTWLAEWLLPLGPFWRWLWVRLCSPSCNPGAWNDNNGIQFNNNCYNYACNIQPGTFAQPGTAGGYNTPTAVNCDEYTKAAKSDGLIEVDCDRLCPFCCYKVALVVAPGDDFHWYRQENNGTWSHKPGGTPAVNTDASGNPITDPRTADRDYSGVGGPNYTAFCGCFCVCSCVTVA